MGRPLASIVIPTRRRAHLLPRALRSVLGQSMQDLEVLVVDDGSNDETESVVRSIADPRVRYLAHTLRRGASAARNTGIEGARGDYVAFLDSDDEWLREKLELQLEIFETGKLPRLGLVYCGFAEIGMGESKTIQPTLRGRIRDELFDLDLPFATSTFVVSRHLLERGLRFDEALPAWQDWDFLVRASEEASVDFSPGVLVLQHRDIGEQHVFSGRNVLEGKAYLLAKYRRDFARRPRALSREHRRLSRLAYLHGDVPAARRHLLRAVRLDPLGVLRAAGRSHNLPDLARAAVGRKV